MGNTTNKTEQEEELLKRYENLSAASEQDKRIIEWLTQRLEKTEKERNTARACVTALKETVQALKQRVYFLESEEISTLYEVSENLH
jgi:polyhydroxyalkanoate synthesis regulator phasin